MKIMRKKCEMDILQMLRFTLRQGNYFRSFTYGFGVVVRDHGEWRPGFYSEFRCTSREHSGLPWGAIFRNVLVLSLIPSSHAHFSRNRFPKCVLSVCAAPRKEHINTYILTGPQNGLFPVFPVFKVLRMGSFQYFQDSGSSEWVGSSISRIQGSWNGPFPNISKFPAPRRPNKKIIRYFK